MRQWLMFFFLIIFLSFKSFSSSNIPSTDDFIESIDFKIERNLITYDGKFKVSFEIPDNFVKKYYVRPVLSNGNLEIFDPDKKEWVRSNDVWSKMPLINHEVFLKISSLGQQKHSLSFEVMNIDSGKVFGLKDINIYGKKVYDKYIDSVNMSIRDIKYLDESSVEKDPLWVQTDSKKMINSIGEQVPENDLPFLWLYGTFVTIFILFLLFFVFLLKRFKRLALR